MKTEIILYILRLSLALGIFSLLYFVFIKKVRNIRFNRYYLLFTLLFSLIIPSIKFHAVFPASRNVSPIIQFSDYSAEKNTAQQELNNRADSTPNDAFKQKPESQLTASTTKLTIYQVFKWFYFLIASVLLLHFVFQLAKISCVIFKSHRKKVNGFSLYINHDVKSPYTFLRFIVLNPKLYSHDELAQVIAHEYEHYKQLHFIDILFMELLKPVLWFVPFIWVYDKEMKENHEYLADEGVLSLNKNIALYQRTLLKGSLGMQYLGISSFLHNSFIKKRITMMTHQKTSSIPLWKLLMLAPAVILCILSCTNKQASSETHDSAESVSIETLQLNKTYQFIEYTNGYFLCRGTYVFLGVDDNGLWQGVQRNFTQHSTLAVTAKVTSDTIEIYTEDPWNETWQITSSKNGVPQGKIIANYTLAQFTDMTFILTDKVSISELMPDYVPKTNVQVAPTVPFLKNEKYYWELWDEASQTSSLSGWYAFENYNPETKELSGTQYNYRMKSKMQIAGSFDNGTITINIGEPWNEVWTAKIENNIFIGEQSYRHNAENFKGNGVR